MFLNSSSLWVATEDRSLPLLISKDGLQPHTTSTIVFLSLNKSFHPEKKLFSDTLFQQQIEYNTGKNEFCVSNIQSVFLDGLQNEQDSLKSGNLCSRSTKLLGITIHHHGFPSFLRLQH